MTRRAIRAAAVGIVGWCTATIVVVAEGGAQSLARKATTIGALLRYPTFFHGQRVAVWSRSETRETVTWLVDDGQRLLCVGPCTAPATDRAEVSGTFWDVGRLEPGDARLGPHDLGGVVERVLGKPWPAAGELFVLVAERAEPVSAPTRPTVRALALEPARYEGQQVTVTGRFRGRNLYGDLPQPPQKSRWDFVLQSADAAVWVTGIEPRGRDFHLDVDARVDTGRWLEVSGTVHYERGLVSIAATRIALAAPPADPAAPVAVAVPKGPAPEVIFSTPSPDDVDVPPDSTVRIQFSRDMDPASFKDRIRASYEDLDRAQEPSAAGPLDFVVEYREGNRVLEMRFRHALDPFRTVRIELLPGIAALDGAVMEAPWTLRFTVGR